MKLVQYDIVTKQDNANRECHEAQVILLSSVRVLTLKTH